MEPYTIPKDEIIKKIGQFTEKRLMGDGESMGSDILKENLKIFQLKL